MTILRGMMIGVALVVAALLPAGSAQSAKLQSWRVVLLAGDDSAAVFDNAVDRLTELLQVRPGVELYRLTSDRRLQTTTRALASARNLDGALKGSAAQGCFVFMTSHGTEKGLYLREDYDSDRLLSPSKLDRILDAQCGERPTVAVVSACHSGVFIGRASKGDNRIWLTAARDDRVSFGCGAEFELTYFDECLIDAWPKSQTWRQLFDRTSTCVRLKESELSEKSSMPQAFFGDGVRDLELP
ncbi:C13 family peptidase [Dongia deserti]|uniref:C13 family peptidase n=1 Tax=Dongia deserti TaxID=2268030 RepID=UPI0013C48FFB|nr:C13 family peptidase [Dongia deserti]